MELYASTLTESKVSKSSGRCTNPVETLNSLIERSSPADLPAVLQSAVQFLLISQSLQSQPEPAVTDSYGVIIGQIESVTGEPFPVSWEPLIRSRTLEEISLSIRAAVQFQRRKQVRDMKALMWAALKERWKPNLKL